jgi:hypothetical protein
MYTVKPELRQKETSYMGRTVRYHIDGSKELNTCILLLSHMVYL